MRVSAIEDVHYKISYLMSSSLTGKKLVTHDPSSEDMFQEPLDTQVTLNISLNEFPNEKRNSNKNIKMSMSRDKFL